MGEIITFLRLKYLYVLKMFTVFLGEGGDMAPAGSATGPTHPKRVSIATKVLKTQMV